MCGAHLHRPLSPQRSANVDSITYRPQQGFAVKGFAKTNASDSYHFLLQLGVVLAGDKNDRSCPALGDQASRQLQAGDTRQIAVEMATHNM